MCYSNMPPKHKIHLLITTILDIKNSYRGPGTSFRGLRTVAEVWGIVAEVWGLVAEVWGLVAED